MKPQESIFRRPKKVFQVFRNIHVYGKAEKSFADRKGKFEWDVIPSKSGHVIEDELYLPEKILDHPDFPTCDLIIIEDDNASNHDVPPSTSIVRNDIAVHPIACNHCFHLSRKILFGIFEIKKKDEIELYLRYGYFEVGIPKRENFKIGNIEKGKPIEIKINGKTDFSLSSRRARMYKEQSYIFDYIGDFEKCKILKEPYKLMEKQVPNERKVVDLIKRLW